MAARRTGVMGFFVLLTLGVIIYVVQRAVRDEPKRPAAPSPQGPAPRLSEAQIERVVVLGAPPSDRFQIDNQRSPYIAGVLGPGTPDFGPAPPSVRLEPDENVIQVEDLGASPFELPTDEEA